MIESSHGCAVLPLRCQPWLLHSSGHRDGQQASAFLQLVLPCAFLAKYSPSPFPHSTRNASPQHQ